MSHILRFRRPSRDDLFRKNSRQIPDYYFRCIFHTQKNIFQRVIHKIVFLKSECVNHRVPCDVLAAISSADWNFKLQVLFNSKLFQELLIVFIPAFSLHTFDSCARVECTPFFLHTQQICPLHQVQDLLVCCHLTSAGVEMRNKCFPTAWLKKHHSRETVLK